MQNSTNTQEGNTQNNTGNENTKPKNSLIIHTQYIKDLSFESPLSPQIFFLPNYDPSQDQEKIDMDVVANQLNQNTFEITIRIQIQTFVPYEKAQQNLIRLYHSRSEVENNETNHHLQGNKDSMKEEAHKHETEAEDNTSVGHSQSEDNSNQDRVDLSHIDSSGKNNLEDGKENDHNTRQNHSEDRKIITHIVDLEYAGIFSFAEDISEPMEKIMYVRCPQILFPYIRAIVTSVRNNSGFPHREMQMIDFMKIFEEKSKSNMK